MVRANIIGKVKEQVLVTVDPDKLEDLGLSLQRVSAAVHVAGRSPGRVR